MRETANRRPSDKAKTDTSWQGVAGWYQKQVGKEGHYFHQHLVIPRTLQMLELKGSERVLDLACGQGIFARAIHPKMEYIGIDIAPDLIKDAQNLDRSRTHGYMVADVTQPLQLNSKFDVVTIILALQNMDNPAGAIANASKYLKAGGKLLIVINHPHFRIPRQTAWAIDEQNKLQYRKVFRYMSKLKIPIDMTPGGDKQTLTWSFHEPLESYFYMFKQNGLLVEDLQEWVSDKTSVGKAAKMENLAREEIPLFMAILAVKQAAVK